jgi:hypothetical protein
VPSVSCRSRFLTTIRRCLRESATSVVAILAAALVAACGGGSGSSGLTPRSERAAIDVALETRACVADSTLLSFCPTDEDNVAGEGRGIFTPFVDTNDIRCFVVDEELTICVFDYFFDPEGFAEGTVFVSATRTFGSDDPWLLSEPAVFLGEDEFEDPLATSDAIFPFDDPADAEPLQLAIVVFNEDPGALPQESATLSELGANLVFVVDRIDTLLLDLPDEEQTIAEALATGACVDGGLSRFCPTDMLYPSEGGDPDELPVGIPPFFFDTEVAVGLDGTVEVPCGLDPGGRTCSFDLTMTIQGLFEIYYPVATRAVDGGVGGLWLLGPEGMDDPELPAEDRREVMTTVVVELPDAARATGAGARFDFQLAVVPDGFPAEPDERFQVLQEVSFDYVFLTDVLEAVVVAPTLRSARSVADGVAVRGAAGAAPADGTRTSLRTRGQRAGVR